PAPGDAKGGSERQTRRLFSGVVANTHRISWLGTSVTQGATIHPKEVNESPTAAASIRSLAGYLCGCGMRAKIDESGCRRVPVTINVAGINCGASADWRAVNHFGA